MLIVFLMPPGRTAIVLRDQRSSAHDNTSRSRSLAISRTPRPNLHGMIESLKGAPREQKKGAAVSGDDGGAGVSRPRDIGLTDAGHDSNTHRKNRTALRTP